MDVLISPLISLIKHCSITSEILTGWKTTASFYFSLILAAHLFLGTSPQLMLDDTVHLTQGSGVMSSSFLAYAQRAILLKKMYYITSTTIKRSWRTCGSSLNTILNLIDYLLHRPSAIDKHSITLMSN